MEEDESEEQMKKRLIEEIREKKAQQMAKKKEMPNYMKPILSWLNRDKSNAGTESRKETSTNFNKSRASIMFPSIYDIKKYKKPSKMHRDSELNEEGLNSLNTKKVINKANSPQAVRSIGQGRNCCCTMRWPSSQNQ